MSKTLAAALVLAVPCFAGPIDPPAGPVSPTYKTLHEIEPRTPISQADIPLTILQPGSYHLTESVIAAGLPDPFVIRIAADNVRLDLRGFTITGSNEVVQALAGIEIDNIVEHVVVENGFIEACVGDGIAGGSTSYVRVERIHSRNNLNEGIDLGSEAIVENCIVSGNGGDGLQVDSFCAIDRVTAHNNGGAGISANSSCTIDACTALGNTGDGFVAQNGNTLRDCTAQSNADGFGGSGGNVLESCTSRSNTGDGFNFTFTSNIFRGCQANMNDAHGFDTGINTVFETCSATNNDLNGFDAASHSTATNCNSYTNQQVGFEFGESATITGCAASDNTDEGFVVGVGASVTGCTSRANLAGFDLGDGSTLQNSSATGNSAAGAVGFNRLRVIGNRFDANNGQGSQSGLIIGAGGADCHIEGNTSTNHVSDGFGVFGSGNFIVRNTASGNGTNYDIAGGNDTGTIVNTPVGAGAWDNFSY